MFGDRARKVHYLDKDGKRTTDIFQARVMTKTVQSYKPPEYEAIFWWTCITEMRNDLREKGCFPAVCKYEGCWLEFYPEHRCKFRLTLPKI